MAAKIFLSPTTRRTCGAVSTSHPACSMSSIPVTTAIAAPSSFLRSAPTSSFKQSPEATTASGRSAQAKPSDRAPIPVTSRCTQLAQRQLPIELLNDAVAFAGGAFQFLAVQNSNRTPRIFDDPPFLQPSRRQANAGTIGSQHHRQKIVSDAQQSRTDPILRQQEPPRKPLFNVVQAIAAGSLCHLQPVNGGVPIQLGVQHWTGVQHGLQCIHVYLEAVSSDLHHRTMRASPQAGGNGYGRKAFVADHTDLDTFPEPGRKD